MSLSWLVPIVTAGVLGSVHCVGMCGGLVAVAAEGSSGLKQRLSVQLGYQGARLLSYGLLGVVSGALGQALDLAGRAAGLGQTAAVVAGVTMTLWGVWAMLNAVGLTLKLPALRLLPKAAAVWLGRAGRRPPLARALLLGGASALLPCGFLYAFALAAAATGSPLGGALVMAALWLGNLPALLGFGLLLSTVLSRVKRHIPLLSAATVFALGLLTLNGRMNLPAFATAQVMSAGALHGGATAAPMPADCPFHARQAK